MRKAVYVDEVLKEVARMNELLHPCDRLMVENLSAMLNVVPAVNWEEDITLMGYRVIDLAIVAKVMQAYQITPQDIEAMCDNIARVYKFVKKEVEQEMQKQWTYLEQSGELSAERVKI